FFPKCLLLFVRGIFIVLTNIYVIRRAFWNRANLTITTRTKKTYGLVISAFFKMLLKSRRILGMLIKTIGFYYHKFKGFIKGIFRYWRTFSKISRKFRISIF